MNYTQGSEWRKWDLHVHTPASIYHKYPGKESEAWEAFFADLEALPPEFKVLGINDYLFLDGYKRVLAERTKGRLPNIDLVLPVIELRLDKFVGHDSHFQRVNFHVIFDEIDPEIIETQFINLLSRDFQLLPPNAALKGRWSAVPTRKSLTDFGQLVIDAAPADRKSQYGRPLYEGFNNFNVALENVQKALTSTYFQGKHLTAVGKTEWDAIKWSDASIAEKRNVIHNADIVFTAADTVAAFQNARNALVDAAVNNRLLDCSDSHELSGATGKDRIGNCFTWIKADTTFAGLQHAIKEYPKRVFVGDTPDKVAKVRTSPTKYINSVQIRKASSSSLTEPWFDGSLRLNHDMVAIIGNKGSGKSALADTLGLLGNTKQGSHFSFLNEQKFRDPRDNKAAHFEATLTWASGTTTKRRLEADADVNSVETIKYLPQNYIETLCNEIAGGEDSEFDRELKQIIFSHVGAAERLGRDTLDDVLQYLTAETQGTIRVLADRIHAINEGIVQHEARGSESFRSQLESQLRSRREELAAHELVKPDAVPEPTQSDELREAAATIRGQISRRKDELGRVNEELVRLEKDRVEAARRIALLDKAITKVDNLSRQYEEFRRSVTSDLRELNLDTPIVLEDVARLTVDREKLTLPREGFAGEMAGILGKLDVTRPGMAAAKKRGLEAELQKLQDSLDEPNRKFVAYQNALEVWTSRRVSIVGDLDTPQSIVWLEHRLGELAGIPAKLQALQSERVGVAREIYRETRKLAEAYRRLYRPVEEFVALQKIASEAIPLSFQVAIVEEGFASGFLEKINRQVRGTFAGIEESHSLVRKRLQTVDFDSEDSVVAFIEEIDSCLHTDRRPGAVAGVRFQVAEQLRKGETPVSVYDYVYSLSFLRPRYTLRYRGHEIHQLSPGERGLLLLVFYLLIDKDDMPLVIDQPEENLDNQTIYEILVRCLSDAKHRRQVVVVTHNPNLAVVCDAEQVIYAERDPASNAVKYEAGAIENPTMNKHIIDVLEGTRPAFKNRDSKYFA